MDIAGSSIDPLFFWREEHDRARAFDVGTSFLATIVRGGSGTVVGRLGARPERDLILYEKESCPFSRLAREALSILDLDADIVPCPEGADVHREQLVRVGGEEQLPFLIDPNTATHLYDSAAIVKHLFETYGEGPPPPPLRSIAIAKRTSQLASKLRGGRGDEKAPRRECDERLELFGYEGGAYTRLVREKLSGYALPWTCRSLARNSPRRHAFEATHGRLQFPFLRDPNTGAELFESDAICRYLDEQYGR